ncbi:hypothetical protein MMC07_003017 [Pseudocyphellaria aurata]|nr:hypothetical protein [Pseudocyphellaria aurata]
MSAKILPSGNKSDESSDLIHRVDGAPRDGSRSLEHSYTSNETSGRGRGADSAAETRRKSQLPQKTPRQSSMHKKGTDRLGVDDTKVSLHGASAKLNGESSLVSTQRAPETSSQRATRTMLPPMKPAKSLSTQRPKFVETHQASQEKDSMASKITGPRLVTSNSRTDVSGLVKTRIYLNPALTAASQKAALAARKISNSHQYEPPFSTLQRQISQKKILQSTAKHSSSYELSSEDVQKQIELVHLHLLLHPAVEVQKEWETSAEKCLQARFQLLSERHIQLKGLVQSHQVSANHSALLEWCNNLPGVEVAEKLQLLSHIFQDVLALIEAGGRYTRILNTFELWFARACCIRDLRDEPRGATEKGLKFLESIGDDWKFEVAGLEMKLSSFSRELRNEGTSQGSSTLAQYLISFQRVLANLLEELGMIRGIESDLMTQEASEIKAMIALSATAYESDTSSIPALYQGVWHAGV